MQKVPATLKATATELRTCQRCPRLLAYHTMGEKNVWRIGITGSGMPFGNLFHKHIAGKFHKDAAMGKLPELARIFQGGTVEMRTHLVNLVQKRYFVPFVTQKGNAFKSELLMAFANGTEFWVRCLADFFSSVPFLFAAPEKNSKLVFSSPEKTLRACYSYTDGKELKISGRYDAMLFNPDTKDVMLFEFKGFKSTNITVELSQTLIYAWLLYKVTGVIPSVTLIYLEDNVPIIYSAYDIKNMLNNLPHLFDVTRRVLEKLCPLPKSSDTTLCPQCEYHTRCDSDWGIDKYEK